MSKSCYLAGLSPRCEAPPLDIPLAPIARSILWLLPRDASLPGPMKTRVNMVDTMTSPCDALGTPPDRLHVSPPIRPWRAHPETFVDRYSLRALSFQVILQSLCALVNPRANPRTSMSVTSMLRGTTCTSSYDSSLCADIIGSSLPVTPLRPGSDLFYQRRYHEADAWIEC